jgi:hypothetical protein
MSEENPFHVKNCSLAAIATGERVNSLLELRDKLATIDDGCIYFHFWGGRMNPKFVHPQYHNDFASWVFHRLHDHVLAEQLNIIDPTEYHSMDELRQDLMEIVEKRLDEHEVILWTTKEDRFPFIYSSIIVFDSPVKILKPEQLVDVIPKLSPSSIFYHFVDARRRTPDRMNDFSMWLKGFGDKYQDLVKAYTSIDPYFLSLTEFRDEITKATERYFKKQDKNG